MEEKEQYVVVSQAAKQSEYSENYIRQLAHQGTVRFRRFGPRAMVVHLGDLIAHKTEMDALGTAKHSPHRPDEPARMECCAPQFATVAR